jgi:hypothetical protein
MALSIRLPSASASKSGWADTLMGGPSAVSSNSMF